ncbi:class I SAM-dependent methyltransferase [Streptomyces polygonati]|uniref:Class I SAM-dependent methyltransferase n=1 Tax=Streptomyces polygonati TaxID=1617087 RepID=A0ABV8HJY1_9ACTN
MILYRPRFVDRACFTAQMFAAFHATGAVAPSSRRLARALARPLAHRSGDRPLAVLEVGAGTGAVSRVLAELLGPDDSLDLVELNPRFAARLRGDRRLTGHDRIRVINAPVTELGRDRRYDVIVSTLPFANFDPPELTAVLDFYRDALAPGGQLAYIAYRAAARARIALGASPGVVRQHRVQAALDEWRRDHAVATSLTVWANLPPARVWHLQAPAAGPYG